MIVKARAHASPRMTPRLAGTLMSPREFDVIDDYEAGWRYELVHGVLVVNPIPLEAQVGPNEYLGYLLLRYRIELAGTATLDETLPERYIRTRASRRLADRVIWAGLGRVPKPRKDVPTIAVEFVSASKRDRLRDYEEKRKEYLEAGVREYWVFDRFQRALTVFQNKKPRKKVVSEGQTYESKLLPGFVVPLGEILAVADRWADSESDS